MTLNVLGGPLEVASTSPMTGYRRNGCCDTGPDDPKSHSICAIVDQRFIAFQSTIDNDIETPRPDLDFPGLKPGDRWCVVATKWLEAYEAGVACPVVLASTNVAALKLVPMAALLDMAIDPPDTV